MILFLNVVFFNICKNDQKYIFENSYITITRFTKYKNCSYTDLNSEYKYSVQQESGETITFKNKGTVSKVYTEDFTYVE